MQKLYSLTARHCALLMLCLFQALKSFLRAPPQVHYLGDPSRGSVWEEAIINCPRHIQLLCMSATVKNPDDLGGWISKVCRWMG